MRHRAMALLAQLLFVGVFFVSGCDADPPEPVANPIDNPDGTPSTPVTPTSTPRDLPQGKVASGEALRVPYILWGGDMATFYGNGGTKTLEGSVFHQQGLVLDLVDGNDFDKQIEDYKAGRSPFLRGTFRMLGVAAEKLGTGDDRPLVFMQMTWSAGDHLVGRDGIKTIADLKGKKVAIQKGGPHIGMLDDILHTARLSWNDIDVVWADDITGPGSPPELFRADDSIAAAFAITPDMLGLTGGLESVGSGAEGTVKGARVAVSTAELSRSIADVYAVKTSYWKQHPDKVKAFTAAYLKSVEEVIDLKKQYETSGSDTYMNLMQLSQNIYGSEVLPTLEEDAHGLLSDCTFAGHPGNVAFFTDEKNAHGFQDFATRSAQLAVERGWAKNKVEVGPSPIDWNSPAITSILTKTNVDRGNRFNAEAVSSEIESMDADGLIDSRTLLNFTISFQPNQTDFDAQLYEAEYKRALQLADRYGNAAMVVRGHSDTTLVLRDAVLAGLENGGLKRSGTKGNYQYFLDGRPLDLEDPRAMSEAISSSNAFRPNGTNDPRKTMQAALNLSRERAEAVRASLIQYARTNSIQFDESQLTAQGVGIREPLVARPRDGDEAAANMRVEFRLVRVSAEAMTASDFDF